MALIWIHIQHAGFGHPAPSVTGLGKKKKEFVFCAGAGTMMVCVLNRLMRKEQNYYRITKPTWPKLVARLSWTPSSGQKKSLKTSSCTGEVINTHREPQWIQEHCSAWMPPLHKTKAVKMLTLPCYHAGTDCTSHLFRVWQTCCSNLHFCPFQVSAVV